jgi:hypothetical protein
MLSLAIAKGCRQSLGIRGSKILLIDDRQLTINQGKNNIVLNS